MNTVYNLCIPLITKNCCTDLSIMTEETILVATLNQKYSISVLLLDGNVLLFQRGILHLALLPYGRATAGWRQRKLIQESRRRFFRDCFPRTSWSSFSLFIWLWLSAAISCCGIVHLRFAAVAVIGHSSDVRFTSFIFLWWNVRQIFRFPQLPLFAITFFTITIKLKHLQTPRRPDCSVSCIIGTLLLRGRCWESSSCNAGTWCGWM